MPPFSPQSRVSHFICTTRQIKTTDWLLRTRSAYVKTRDRIAEFGILSVRSAGRVIKLRGLSDTYEDIRRH